MPATGYLRRQRLRFWRESPFCRECGAETILPEELAARLGVPVNDLPKRKHSGSLLDRMATIDHCYTRYEEGRRRRSPKGSHQLVCHGCNQRRQREVVGGLPVWELWARSGSYPKRLTNTVEKMCRHCGWLYEDRLGEPVPFHDWRKGGVVSVVCPGTGLPSLNAWVGVPVVYKGKRRHA